MIKLKTKDKTLEDIRMAYIKKSLFSDDDKMYVSEGIEDSFSSDTYKYEIVRK